MKRNSFRSALALLILVLALPAIAQQSADGAPSADNKSTLDERLYHLLMDSTVTHVDRHIIIDRRELIATNEHAISRCPQRKLGNTVYRSDFFVEQKGKKYQPVADGKHPVETLTNLLLGIVDAGDRKAVVTMHSYGNKTTEILLPLRELLDKLSLGGRQLYCAVTEINANEAKAVVMAHDPVRNDVHMAQFSVPTKQVANRKATLTVDLRGNIPQANLKHDN